MAKPIKVVLTGATGNIGYSLLFRLASGGVFGEETPVEIGLMGVFPSRNSAREGLMMEIEDCAFPLLARLTSTTDLSQGFSGADWIILIGSMPRKQGMERSDLLEVNGRMFMEQGRQIARQAPDAKVLVVGNPCNTNAYIGMNFAKDKMPARNWFALTRLDENRAKALLAKKSGVELGEVENVCIWGNHSSTQYPDFENARIGGRPAEEAVGDRKWLENDFIKTVQSRGAQIIAARGKSSAASAANAVIDTIKSLHYPSAPDQWHSVGVLSDGSYGVDEGLICSFPVRVKADGDWEIVKGLQLGEFAKKKISASVDELKSEAQTVRELFGF